MRIVILTQYYPPEPVRIPSALASGLAERGHSVRVLTGYPNYPDGVLADGFRQRVNWQQDESGVSVRRIPLFISHSGNALGRFANYLSFSLSSWATLPFLRNADVVYVYATQMTAAVAPHFWSRLRRLPFVLHVQDLWPESVTGSSMVRGGIAKRTINGILRPWLSAVYRRSAAVIAIAPTMHSMLADRGVPGAKLHTVLNWADESEALAPRNTVAGRATDPPGLSLVYAGNIGELQDLETVIRAVALVTDLPGFTFTVVGSGLAAQRLKDLTVSLGATNIEFRGRVEQSAMAAIYASSDFQMVALADLPIFRGTIPSKLQGSLVNGIPVITTVAGDVTDIVRSNRIGLASIPADVDALATTFRAAYALSIDERQAMGENARNFYASEMSMKNGIDRIEQILLSATGLPSRKSTHVPQL